MRITLKQGDTRHAVRATLKKADGTTVDLTGATVIFKMAEREGAVVVNREATASTDGVVEFIFNVGETDKVGIHHAEFFVTYVDGRVETFPNKGKIEIYVESRIGGI